MRRKDKEIVVKEEMLYIIRKEIEPIILEKLIDRGAGWITLWSA